MTKNTGYFYLYCTTFALIMIFLHIDLLDGALEESFLFLHIAVVFFGIQQFILFAVLKSDPQKQNTKVSEEPLTGLPPISRMEEIMKQYFADPAHQEGGFSMVCLDLASSRHLSFMIGHTLADRLLQILGHALRQNYFCAVYNGGCRFTFLAHSAPALPVDINNALTEAVAEAMGRQYTSIVEFRFGICPVDMHLRTFDEIYTAAQLALRCTGDDPNLHALVYDKAMEDHINLQQKIEINMLHALSKEEFQVHIQPKFSVATNKCCSCEALLRWESEDLGKISPDVFIPLFEKNGFIVEIDFYVLSCVFQKIQQALSEGRKVYPISVNQSKVTIVFPNYLERLQKLIQRYPIPLKLIDLEVTESILESDSDTMYSFIYALKEMGFTISLDDFGSGYSSLNVLQSLPVDTLKIDREFLMRADRSEKSKTIIRNIVNMSQELGINTVCEGVETKEQLEFLRTTGCNFAQGYYCARPMPFEEYEKTFLTFLGENRTSRENDEETSLLKSSFEIDTAC